MPQRGYGLQPRVAASATLGTSKKRNCNPDWSGLCRFSKTSTKQAQPRCGWGQARFLYPG